MKKLCRYLVLLAAAVFWPQAVRAQDPPPVIADYDAPAAPVTLDAFPKGIWNFQFRTGPYFSPVAEIGPEQPTYNFMIQSFRLGRATRIGFQEGILRGSLEPIMELAVGAATSDLGNIFIGPSWMMRYNFMQPERRVVPYYQAGIGVQYNDAYKDLTQDSLGQSVQFVLQTQVGVRWFIGPRASFDIEGGYFHLSNANMSDRNGGINAFGATLGFSYFFGGPNYPPRY